MEKIFIILVVMLAVGLVVYLFLYWKKYIAQKETEELIKACKNADIDKMIKLLKKGINPNTEVEVEVGGAIVWRKARRTLLDISQQESVKKLLRAYGAKTIGEVLEEEAAIEKARHDAEVAEIRRQDAILEAEKKAKEEENLRKVEAFLSSKGKKA